MHRNDENLTWYTLQFNSNELDVIVPWSQFLKIRKNAICWTDKSVSSGWLSLIFYYSGLSTIKYCPTFQQLAPGLLINTLNTIHPF